MSVGVEIIGARKISKPIEVGGESLMRGTLGLTLRLPTGDRIEVEVLSRMDEALVREALRGSSIALPRL